jgi:hypothetical protein
MSTKDTTARVRRLPPHLEAIEQAIRERADAKRPRAPLSKQGSIVVRRMVTRLANLAGVRRLASHAATFARAAAVLQAREFTRGSERAVYEGGIKTLAKWLGVIGSLPPVTKNTEPLPALVRHKALRRRRVGSRMLEDYGVEPSDVAMVAMTGEVRPGELGYFEVSERYDSGARYTHTALYFVAEVGPKCQQNEWTPQAGICLRYEADKCVGNHVGSFEAPVLNDFANIKRWDAAHAYGRVVGFERRREPVETTLPLRPYDEREGGPTTSFGVWPTATKPEQPTQGRQRRDSETEQKLAELRNRHDRLNHDDEITDCSARFRLEKQIHDLEREASADEWPEYIPG